MHQLSLLTIILISLFLFHQCESSPKQAYKTNQTYQQYKELALTSLDSVVQLKKRELKNYLKSIQFKAANVHSDEVLLNFFLLQETFQHIQTQNITSKIEKKNREIEQAINRHYIQKYNSFYDILMIDSTGNIFHTIRKEKDYKSNIFTGKLANTQLSKKLRKRINESFVDFQFYDISNEPSAFFIEPIHNENQFLGWMVFQFSIEKINNIFSIDNNLGATGEVILVNKKHYMLTDSRFLPQTTILKQQLSKENILSKFAEKKGHKTVVDYRNFSVISSFEVFSLFSNDWLIIAKMNEAEVLTNFFKKDTKKLDSCLPNSLKIIDRSYSSEPVPQTYLEVGIDEYKRSDDDKILYTHGISECTGLLVTLPGEKSYLAHISPYDKLYGEHKTDIIGHLLNKITYLEISGAQLQLLQFTLVAPHKRTAKTLIKRLIKRGIFLNQIKIIYNENARVADVMHSVPDNKTIIYWHMQESLQTKCENAAHILPLNQKNMHLTVLHSNNRAQ